MSESGKLSAKQERFCREYLIDLNATQAAIRAGYSPNTAESQASRLLTNVKVARRISELKRSRNNELDIDAKYVLKRLVEIDKLDVLDILSDDGTFKAISEWPKPWRTYVSGIDLSEIWEGSGDERTQIGILKKMKWPDKVKNLELLGKHVEVQAFKDKVEHEGGLVAPVLNITLQKNDK